MPNNHLKLNLGLLDLSLAQESLTEFVKQAWPILEPTTPLHWNWHLDAICEYLEAVAAGEITRLIINLPPRSGKSILASVMWPAWVWARQPSTRWLCASYSAILANKLSTDRRSVITSPWYQQRWPIQLAADQNQKSEFGNTGRGHMIATSVSGSATGRGGDFIVADDLQNPEMAESAAERETVNRFFDETLTTRLDDKRRGRMVVIQQRTHQADLTGHLLEQGGWTQLCLPAEFERRTAIAMPRSGREVVRRCSGLSAKVALNLMLLKSGSGPMATPANTCKIRLHAAATYSSNNGLDGIAIIRSSTWSFSPGTALIRLAS